MPKNFFPTIIVKCYFCFCCSTKIRKKERKIIIFLSTLESESENIDIDSLVDTNSIIKLTSSRRMHEVLVEVEVSWHVVVVTFFSTTRVKNIYSKLYTRGSKWTSCDIIKAISDRARCYRYSMGSSFTEERLFKTTSKNVVEREDWIEKIFTHRIVETSIELFIQNCNTWHDKLENIGLKKFIGLRKLRWYKFDRKKFDYIRIYLR